MSTKTITTSQQVRALSYYLVVEKNTAIEELHEHLKEGFERHISGGQKTTGDNSLGVQQDLPSFRKFVFGYKESKIANTSSDAVKGIFSRYLTAEEIDEVLTNPAPKKFQIPSGISIRTLDGQIQCLGRYVSECKGLFNTLCKRNGIELNHRTELANFLVGEHRGVLRLHENLKQKLLESFKDLISQEEIEEVLGKDIPLWTSAPQEPLQEETPLPVPAPSRLEMVVPLMPAWKALMDGEITSEDKIQALIRKTLAAHFGKIASGKFEEPEPEILKWDDPVI